MYLDINKPCEAHGVVAGHGKQSVCDTCGAATDAEAFAALKLVIGRNFDLWPAFDGRQPALPLHARRKEPSRFPGLFASLSVRGIWP